MNNRTVPLFISWLIAICSLLGSMYFSEVAKFPPCVLCWYQRIAIYPLVPIIAVGIVRRDKGLPYYVLPLAVIGWLIAVFHNLLYYEILPHAASPCQAGVSCTTKFIEWFGFVTIPLLSLVALSAIIACMILTIRIDRRNSSL